MPKVAPAFARPPLGPGSGPAWAPRRSVWLAASIIVLAAWAAYANSLSAPFVYDDLKSISLNPTIRHLWPLGPVLSPPPGGGLSGRPLANLSLAMNYAMCGETVEGFHAVNVALHALAGLLLLGLVRRTLLRPELRSRFESAALPLAWAAAMLWLLHPLQTEAVTYISQRTEVLMGLCYLGTLYCFVRGVESPTPVRWWAGSIAFCLLGVASKEAIVTVPLVVWLYDRTFVAGTFRDAWRQRRGYYLGLAGSWLLLAWFMRDLPSRQVGYGFGVTAWSNALTECRAVLHYLRLTLWPHPLVFDYGVAAPPSLASAWPSVLLLLVLVAATVVALVRWPKVGFVAAWIFVILAPTSSVVPVVLQPIAEHRMYLPLAGAVVLAVLVLHAWLGRWTTAVVVVLAAGLGCVTVQRNEAYRSEAALWGDTVAQRPDNSRARTNLGSALARDGRFDEARGHFAAAVRLRPDDVVARVNLATVLLELNRPAEALEHGTVAVRLAPNSAEAHCVLGGALGGLGRLDQAQAQFEAALRLQPGNAVALDNMDRLRAVRAGSPVR